MSNDGLTSTPSVVEDTLLWRNSRESSGGVPSVSRCAQETQSTPEFVRSPMSTDLTAICKITAISKYRRSNVHG
jgi:hypothetical protein